MKALDKHLQLSESQIPHDAVNRVEGDRKDNAYDRGIEGCGDTFEQALDTRNGFLQISV